jgi:hypothetical protein
MNGGGAVFPAMTSPGVHSPYSGLSQHKLLYFLKLICLNLGPVYSVRILDPDSAIELWSDVCAHFGVIYDLRYTIKYDGIYDITFY